tara:strand:+ start:17 stop:667 length:651 start_codon:yes stop_codon:yes gene_type:complete
MKPIQRINTGSQHGIPIKGKGIKRNFKIGAGPNKFEANAHRRVPTYSRVTNFLNEMGKDFSDHDVYLWGSWPDKKTWDVDFLLHNPEVNFKQMEDISKRGLDVSLNENQFLADIGYTNSKIQSFKEIAHNYNKNNKMTAKNGYVYGAQWFVDDKLYKDRTKFKNGVVHPKSNNILKINSLTPYPKMIKSIENGSFDKVYGYKPIKIKDRKKIYGTI